MGYGFIQLFVFALLLCFFGIVAEASASRTVKLADGEMTKVFVEQGFTTRIKFDAHPEPGLVGDQDGFKVEYLKNIVAIKPLIGHGETNLFITTKDGEFGFQIVSAKGHHDNTVYAKSSAQGVFATNAPTKEKTAVFVDDLLTKKVGRSVNLAGCTVTLSSISIPKSHTAIVLKLKAVPLSKAPVAFVPNSFSISQNGKVIPIENIFVEPKGDGSQAILILVRENLLVLNQAAQIVIARSDKSTPVKLPFNTDVK